MPRSLVGVSFKRLRDYFEKKYEGGGIIRSTILELCL